MNVTKSQLKTKTPEDLAKLKQQYDSITDINQLKEQAYFIHVQYFYERDRRQYLADILREYVKHIENLTTDEKFARDIKTLMHGNFDDLCQSIVDLSTKKNGKPLNNEMKQVVELVKNAQKKYNTDSTIFCDKWAENLAQRDMSKS